MILDGLNGTAVGVLTQNNVAAGINFRSGGESRGTLTHVTSINNAWAFNIRSDGDYTTLANGVIPNEVISLDGIGNQISNLAFSDSLTTYANTADNSFHQNLLVVSGTQCASGLGSNQGLTSGTREPTGTGLNFLNPLRGWGRDGLVSFPDPSQQGSCNGIALTVLFGFFN